MAFTDGVIEGKSPDSEDFGEERLYRLIASHYRESAQKIVDAIIGELTEHQRGVDRSDDISLLVIKARE